MSFFLPFGLSVRLHRRNFERDKSDLIAYNFFFSRSIDGENEMMYEREWTIMKITHTNTHTYTTSSTTSDFILLSVDGEMGVCASLNERHQVAGGERRDEDWERAMKAPMQSKRANTKYMLDSPKPQNELYISVEFQENKIQVQCGNLPPKKLDEHSNSTTKHEHEHAPTHKQCMHHCERAFNIYTSVLQIKLLEIVHN